MDYGKRSGRRVGHYWRFGTVSNGGRRGRGRTRNQHAFGQPSDAIVETRLGDRTVFFLPRHGRGHRLLPSEVPARANVCALKMLGVTHVLAVSACGIMREEIAPGDMVVPDQIFDRTRGQRPSTFFGDGIVGHLPFADPFCGELRELLLQSAGETDATVRRGTYICMEGPLFHARRVYFLSETVDAAVIGMTALPKPSSREAELCYAMLAIGTDYDCWHEEEEDVTIEQVLAVMQANAATAHQIVRTGRGAAARSTCACLAQRRTPL